MMHAQESVPIIRLFHVFKRFGAQTALRDISLEVEENELVFLTGPSGAGKSSLLKLLYLAESASEGQILIDGVNLSRIPKARIPLLRRKIGVIFQDFKLIPTRTVFDNVALVLEAAGQKRSFIGKKVRHVLRQVGMEEKMGHFPLSLSGGEQQKVAVARAVAAAPRIILADEPTGSLDPRSARVILDLLHGFHGQGATVVIATHDESLYGKGTHRVVFLKDGCVDSEIRP